MACLICCHFFRVATYFQSAIYYITLISPYWYLEPNIEQDTFLQQMLAIILCTTTNSEENLSIINELFGLLKKVIDSAIKVDMYQELSDINSNIIKHKGYLPKRLQSFVEQTFKGKHILRININNNENAKGGSKDFVSAEDKQYRYYAKTCQTSIIRLVVRPIRLLRALGIRVIGHWNRIIRSTVKLLYNDIGKIKFYWYNKFLIVYWYIEDQAVIRFEIIGSLGALDLLVIKETKSTAINIEVINDKEYCMLCIEHNCFS
ncbi:hypothetical protein RhiirA4_457692 [Rhizophagus irregularis]|uniref:Uncharacterized protein n=1 Tax=Rhizophagus irregularis TaxID=588596 RepID=A0A2I1GAI7_9GLOM|nr:hypothetical protein RhiirA4_457692 [Rhizophagus irregularis]